MACYYEFTRCGRRLKSAESPRNRLSMSVELRKEGPTFSIFTARYETKVGGILLRTVMQLIFIMILSTSTYFITLIDYISARRLLRSGLTAGSGKGAVVKTVLGTEICDDLRHLSQPTLFVQGCELITVRTASYPALKVTGDGLSLPRIKDQEGIDGTTPIFRLELGATREQPVSNIDGIISVKCRNERIGGVVCRTGGSQRSTGTSCYAQQARGQRADSACDTI